MKHKTLLQGSVKGINLVYLKSRAEFENRTLSNLLDTVLDAVRLADEKNYFDSPVKQPSPAPMYSATVFNPFNPSNRPPDPIELDDDNEETI
jgi:hypothetical protein